MAVTTMLFSLLTYALPSTASAATEDMASRAPAGAPEMDPVTKALYQALDERARSQSDFERNEAAGRPKENGTKKQLKIELGDELGGSAFPLERRERFAARIHDQDSELPTIESKLDAESREIRSQIRSEQQDNRRQKVRTSRRSHWIDD